MAKSRVEAASTVAQATRAVRTVLSEASPAELEAVIRTANGSDEILDPTLWGAEPSRSEEVLGTVANLRKQFARRREVETASVTRSEAAELLGTSEQAVTDLLETHRLLGFKRGRRWVIPAWQFDADSERGVLDGLADLDEVFPGGVVTLSDWVTRPSADLADQAPRDVLAAGEIETVVRIASELTAAAW